MPVPVLRGPGKGCSMDSSTKKKLLDAEAIARYDPFSSHNNIRVTATYEDGSGEGELIVTRESLNPHGIVHGGALAALADTVGGAATFAAYRRGCVTVNYSMNFLRPAWGSNRKIRCRAQAVKLGRTLSVFGMSLTDDEGVEVASGNFTFYITGWMKSEEEKEPGAI